MGKRVFHLAFPLWLTVVLILTLAPVEAVSSSIDCNATIRSWKLDPNYRDYAATCTCPSPTSKPVCGRGSSGSGSSSAGSNPNDFSLMVGEAFFTALLNPAPPQKPFSKPLKPSVSSNPVYAKAQEKLQQMRLPADKADFILAEAFRSQRQIVAGYHPGDTMQQLSLARCLSMGASEMAARGELEEASWLLRQEAFALSGDLVEAVPGFCEPVPEPPGVGTGVGKRDSDVEGLRADLELVERKREELRAAREDVREARKAVVQWQEIRRDLAAAVDAATDPDVKEKKGGALEEALRMLAESEKLEADAELLVEESEKLFSDYKVAARKAGNGVAGGTP